MRRFLVPLVPALLLGANFLAATPLPAAEETPAPKPRHGGSMSVTKAHAFETVLTPFGVRVYLYTDEYAPAMVEKANGSATLTLPDGKTLDVKLVPEAPGEKEPITYFCPMHAEVVQDQPGQCQPCGGMVLFKQDRLYGQADLSKVKLGDVKATIRVAGMRGSEKEATFTPAFRAPDGKAEGSQSGPGSCPMQTQAAGPGACAATGKACTMAGGPSTGTGTSHSGH